MDATLAEAVDLVVRHTGHERFRWLAEHRRDEYAPVILRRAAALRDAPPPPPAPPVRAADVVLRSYCASWSGYGNIAEHLGRQLERLGLRAGYAPLQYDETFLPMSPFVRDRVRADPPPGARVLQLATPQHPVEPDRRTVVFTMWESTRIGPDVAANLNRAGAVIVPCAFNAEGFRASGVTVPIHLVPLGVDPAEGYTPRPWRESGPFTFGMAGRMAHGGIRKNLNEAMAAFTEAFPGREDVRLSVKVFEDCLAALRIPADPRIELVTTPMTSHGMADWYGSIDCLFVPSRGEGWGLHTHQSMACARPVIAADYSGTREFWTPDCGWALPFEEGPAGEFYSGQGDWAVPSPDGMVRAFRAAASSRDECRRKGALAAAKAARFTWDAAGDRLVEVLRAAGFLPRPAAPRRTPPWVEQAKSCPYLEPSGCGCQKAKCWAGRGDRWHGDAFGLVSLADCRRCLSGA